MTINFNTQKQEGSIDTLRNIDVLLKKRVLGGSTLFRRCEIKTSVV